MFPSSRAKNECVDFGILKSESSPAGAPKPLDVLSIFLNGVLRQNVTGYFMSLRHLGSHSHWSNNAQSPKQKNTSDPKMKIRKKDGWCDDGGRSKIYYFLFHNQADSHKSSTNMIYLCSSVEVDLPGASAVPSRWFRLVVVGEQHFRMKESWSQLLGIEICWHRPEQSKPSQSAFQHNNLVNKK